jgi:hypothetical protein
MQHRADLLLSLALTSALTVGSLSAASAATPPPSPELAKKCRELALKAHPQAKAGSISGSATLQRLYFQSCIANGGNIEQQQKQE